MRLVFAGTPAFARVALERLHGAGHEVALVLTQPDRPAGRGMKLQPSAVKQFALDQALPIAQPRSLRLDGKYPDDAAAARLTLQATPVDAMVVAAYGLMLPQWVLDLPVHGCFNIHASLLPRWRGAAPIHRAIEAGDDETGVTIMQMDAGLDTGDMLQVESLPILATDTTATLQDKLSVLGGSLMLETLQSVADGGLRPAHQPTHGVTYAHKIEKHETSIDWTQAATAIERRIRAFNPLPGASTIFGTEVIKLFCSQIDSDIRISGKVCGTVLSSDQAGVSVQCGHGVLRLTELQRAGGKRLCASEFLRGFALPVGAVLASPAG